MVYNSPCVSFTRSLTLGVDSILMSGQKNSGIASIAFPWPRPKTGDGNVARTQEILKY